MEPVQRKQSISSIAKNKYRPCKMVKKKVTHAEKGIITLQGEARSLDTSHECLCGPGPCSHIFGYMGSEGLVFNRLL